MYMDLMLRVATFGGKQTARQKDFVRARSARNRTKAAALAFQAFFGDHSFWYSITQVQ